MKRALNITLLLTTLGGLGATLAAMLPDGLNGDEVWALTGAIVAALSALFIDRDGDGIPPILDRTPGAIVLVGVLLVVGCGGGQSAPSAMPTSVGVEGDAAFRGLYEWTPDGSVASYEAQGALTVSGALQLCLADGLCQPADLDVTIDAESGDSLSDGLAVTICYGVPLMPARRCVTAHEVSD